MGADVQDRTCGLSQVERQAIVFCSGGSLWHDAGVHRLCFLYDKDDDPR